MKVNNKVDLLEVFKDREKEIVIRILEKYEINKILEIKKINGDYKVYTDGFVLCLKKMKHGAKRIKNASDFVEELSKIGFNNTSQYLKTYDGNVFVKYKKMIYYTLVWIDGNECHLENIAEAQKCVELLGKFHLACSKLENIRIHVKNNIKNWPQICSNNIIELEKFKKIIENKRLKNEFDLAYFKFIDDNISTGTLALKILNTSNYYNLSKLALDKKTICQFSLAYERSFARVKNSYVMNLNNLGIDLHINDFGRVLKKLMYKNEYQWDFYKAKLLIEAYNLENKLTKNELEIMLALIVFPYKFSKLGKKRYIKHKNWDEIKYMHKLNRVIKYNELQQKFIKNYLNYVATYV